MIAASNFLDYYPNVVQIIDDYLKSMTVDFVRDHFIELLHYSTKGGKMFRGILAASTYCELLDIPPDSKEAYPGYILGWALEVLQGAYLVADDLMDRSETRRGQTCWYLKPNVGNSAVNDVLIMENLAIILVESLGEKYLPLTVVDSIVSAFRKINVLTTMGQSFDYKCKSYSFDCYKVIVENKTAYYTIIIPFLVGCIASQKVPTELSKSDEFLNYLKRVGFYFQAQDDWLDVYGDVSVTGKIGTDISDGKVTWLACTALDHANEEQRNEILGNIGKSEKESQEKVKLLYDQIGIQKLYSEFVEKENSYFVEELSKLDERLPKKTIKALLDKLIKRKA
ncbi:Farnesyl pyrophosphate synthase [Tritrichomonas foetus]|uniref:Farnesyl pyrophosphate synthase n=1 Tax=Tritrichomonas foetus TaxID=1144522 RepID=A0A1J4K165_9EUKA|nr:Farnesyl pyrophosphate synthase [Tritrichomonas foetus]|eukprot:OHT04528.1 Farnesyl pyrophosphate synthase [Tritrichomonas foetus]